MSTYIAVVQPVTPEWLTAVLRQEGILLQGEVITVEREATDVLNSRTDHLLLHYSADAAPGVPTRLILKQNIQEAWGIEAGAQEVTFYTLVASLREHPPGIVPCYAAAYDAQSGQSYLLFQDLSATHQAPVTRDQQIGIVEGVPPAAYNDAVVETLAQVHAYWWDHPFRETDRFDVGYWSRNAERFEQYLQRRRHSWDGLMAREHAWFPDDVRDLYEHVLGHLHRHWAQYLEPRFRAKRNLTLIHGDAYFCNFLVPRVPGRGATYLLDWQSPSFDIGAYDLANLCAAFWTSRQRHEDQREEIMLRRYHTVLQQNGVHDYSWDDLLTDYRTSLIFWLLMPVQDGYDGSGTEYWWPKMQCLVAAFREWHCDHLLGI
jgi:hypothetical protein